MEEEQKKRNRKRKGLGGLDKEKKNKLKVGHFHSESRLYPLQLQNPSLIEICLLNMLLSFKT